MRLEIEPPDSPQGLHRLCQDLEKTGGELSLEGPVLEAVVAAGAQAFSALWLAGARDITISLERGADQAVLRLECRGLEPREQTGQEPEAAAHEPEAAAHEPEAAAQEPPVGLGPALFSPPALRVSYFNREGQAVWSAMWEL